MKITHIETELGDSILESLRKNGWKKHKEYSWLAFDKGIDYDSYSLKKGNLRLEFEWTNWFEWEVSGSREAIEDIARAYDLAIEED